MENGIRTCPKLGLQVTRCHKQILFSSFSCKLQPSVPYWEWECSVVNRRVIHGDKWAEVGPEERRRVSPWVMSY